MDRLGGETYSGVRLDVRWPMKALCLGVVLALLIFDPAFAQDTCRDHCDDELEACLDLGGGPRSLAQCRSAHEACVAACPGSSKGAGAHRPMVAPLAVAGVNARLAPALASSSPDRALAPRCRHWLPHAQSPSWSLRGLAYTLRFCKVPHLPTVADRFRVLINRRQEHSEASKCTR